jgi:hypothetical protein
MRMACGQPMRRHRLLPFGELEHSRDATDRAALFEKEGEGRLVAWWRCV